MTQVETPYRPRGRFLGRYDFVCPYCGHAAMYRLQLGQWRITCKGEHCRKVIGLGMHCYDLSGCRGKMPVPADMTMPVLPVVKYAKGDGITVAVEVPDADD